MSLYDIKRIEGYDVTILRFVSPNTSLEWFCAYVRLKGKLSKEEYSYETLREGNVVGVDTNHVHNWQQDKEEKLKDCIKQITRVIREHKSR